MANRKVLIGDPLNLDHSPWQPGDVLVLPDDTALPSAAQVDKPNIHPPINTTVIAVGTEVTVFTLDLDDVPGTVDKIYGGVGEKCSGYIDIRIISSEPSTEQEQECAVIRQHVARTNGGALNTIGPMIVDDISTLMAEVGIVSADPMTISLTNSNGHTVQVAVTGFLFDSTD